LKFSFENPLQLPVALWTKCNDLALGIQTGPEAAPNLTLYAAEPWRGDYCAEARYGDNFRYASIGYRHIRKILRVLNPGPQDIFYDIGCGMGRVLCVAAQRPLRKCVGVELLESLCQIARQNALKLRRRRSPIQIICGDAANISSADGTIYFLFNPFGPETLRATFDNIRSSLAQNPRPIQIVYYHCKYKSAIEDLSWLMATHEFSDFGGVPVTIWQHRTS
jgi:SAM-dependent methyltransferase